MTGRAARRALGALGVWAVVVGGAAGCGQGSAEPAAGDASATADPPEYCAGRGGDDAEFWDRVHQSCRVAQDGDLAQARALRSVLRQGSEEDVARFHRTLVRLNHALRDTSDLRAVADAVCAPGLGLGNDLGTDYRSWVIAHGQIAYEAVLEDPDRLRDFPDAQAGCGLGEFFGAAARDLYLERTGLTFDESGLPLIED